MPKTTPVPYEVRKEILKVHVLDPGKSARQVGKDFKLHHTTVLKIWNGEYAETESDEVSVLQETSTVKGDSWTISLPKTSIHTLEELIEYCEVDLSVWEVERFVCNKWEMGYKDEKGNADTVPLFQVKAFLKRKKNIEAAQKEIEELKALAKTLVLPKPVIHKKTKSSELMLEINFPDTHFGKLAWGVETGHGNYDVKIAEEVYWKALETILSRVDHFQFEYILFVIGNDILNSDDIEGRTTSGTYVSSDARYHKTFAAVRTTMVKAVERLRQIAPVKIVIVSGNHDQLSCWHLGDSLECYFHGYKDVEIDNLPRQRKYHRFGNVMLMLTHGHKGKRQDYPLLMASEQPEMFGSTKYRECHTGHTHMTKLDEQHGIRVRVLPALCAADDWLATNGFVGNLRNAEGYVWSKEEGLIGQVYYTVPE